MSEREEEKSRGFKVEDRRRFSAEGELKPEHRAEESRPEQPPPQPAAAAAPPPEAPGASAAEEQARQSFAQSAPPPDGEINFATFVMSLSTQALLLLGELPEAGDEQPAPDLPGAQQLIDILGMLQTKTRGNLDAEEEALLRSILFDLRMKYVETARHQH